MRCNSIWQLIQLPEPTASCERIFCKAAGCEEATTFTFQSIQGRLLAEFKCESRAIDIDCRGDNRWRLALDCITHHHHHRGSRFGWLTVSRRWKRHLVSRFEFERLALSEEQAREKLMIYCNLHLAAPLAAGCVASVAQIELAAGGA